MKPYYEDHLVKVYNGDALEVLKTLPDGHIQTVVTSPPYWGLRDYGIDGQLGLEKTPEEYIKKMVEIFREVKRVLKKDGTVWLNLGDSYSGSCCGSNDYRSVNSSLSKNNKIYKGQKPGLPANLKPKDLIGIPWRVAFALQADGWYLRQDIIWDKPNPMPESVTDRCTKSHEYIFLLTKSVKYYYDADAIKTKRNCSIHDKRVRIGRKRFPTKLVNGIRGNTPDKIYEYANKHSVWTVPTKPYKAAHFATFPPKLIMPCIKAGSKEGDIVLDPFGGSGTTADVSKKLGRQCISIELNIKYCKLHEERWPNHELVF